VRDLLLFFKKKRENLQPSLHIFLKGSNKQKKEGNFIKMLWPKEMMFFLTDVKNVIYTEWIANSSYFACRGREHGNNRLSKMIM
jgi:hypothetical protein